VPSVQFRDVEYRGTCVADGAASALYYLGDRDAAESVHSKTKKIYDRTDGSLTNLASLSEVMRTFSYNVEGVKQLTGGEADRERSNLKDILLRVPRSPHPTCVVLEDQIGTRNHSVTLVGDYLFDSNEEYALPLTQASLDRCCADDSNPHAKYTCKGIVEAYRFVAGRNARKRMKISATEYRQVGKATKKKKTRLFRIRIPLPVHLY
jgi:hypothetical protein